jgi:succinate dehydrogenase / fumarate reductase membrane anchor subunit
MKADMRDPLARVRGLGSARQGTGHWIAQRITAVALLPLAAWFLLSAFGLGGYADARAFLAQPLNGVLTAALVLCLFHHAQLGLQVVIEDYVHQRTLELALLVLVKSGAALAAIASLFAIVRIALGS